MGAKRWKVGVGGVTAAGVGEDAGGEVGDKGIGREGGPVVSGAESREDGGADNGAERREDGGAAGRFGDKGDGYAAGHPGLGGSSGHRWAAWVLAAWLLGVVPPVAAERVTPGLLLAEVYGAQVEPEGYWVSEKLDGVRAYWDGQRLWSRQGLPLAVPAWFVAGWPAVPLDGELWLGRGRFEAMAALLQKGDPEAALWREVRYMLFELPGAAGSFSQRLAALTQQVAAAGLPWLQLVPQERLADRAALQQRLQAIVAAGGEGLMLHQAEAPYLVGRNPALLKLKPFLDGEAKVVGYRAGRGRLAGQVGALLLETPEGRRFALGSGLSDALRRQPPALGSAVTYRYSGLTRHGLPRFPRFHRLAGFAG